MRPHVICHMTTSIDGKVTGKFLETPQGLMASDEYYRVHRDFHADAFACGRITMEGSFTGGWYPDLKPFEGVSVSRDDHVADPDAGFFCVAFDRRGRLGWKTPVIEDDDPGYDGAHIVEVLCVDAKDEYLAWLRSVGISYIFAGRKEMDLSLALSKLYNLFNIRVLLLEGGSVLNGAFAREDLIDELSLITAPVTADPDDLPLFSKSGMHSWELEAVSDRNGILISKYSKQKDF